MILETIRLLTDALASTEEYGANTQIAAVEKDPTDSTPPAIASFGDETRDNDVALQRVEGTLPALVVSIGSDTPMVADPMSDVREGTVAVQAILVYDNVETARARQDFLYTIRAIIKAVRIWMDNSNASVRTRNNIHVQSLTEISVGDIFAPTQDGNVAGTITFTFLVRDVAV